MSQAEAAPLMSIQDMMKHAGKSYSTVTKWSSGVLASPYPEPVRNGKKFLGWRREDIERADERNRYSTADYLYGKAGKQ
ncbi:hypothetical protein D2E25_0277 [Bifidobacterium goeldii]|uniref:Uncharacterized protein n=1 Tax=Bifidobacterium goeldii TaxID=2306975 RepID=A0A430FMN0_9BIFI|nr:hypothetical protein [Bifidobacterium goeldii]RSX53971.1 hypothetical protein D2E25_0277 [Bifidobacterium goeldii]